MVTNTNDSAAVIPVIEFGTTGSSANSSHDFRIWVDTATGFKNFHSAQDDLCAYPSPIGYMYKNSMIKYVFTRGDTYSYGSHVMVEGTFFDKDGERTDIMANSDGRILNAKTNGFVWISLHPSPRTYWSTKTTIEN